MPRRRNEDLRRGLVCLLRGVELEGDDALRLGEIPDSHGGREVAVDRLDSELMVAIDEGEPHLPSELDRGLLSEGCLIGSNLLVVDKLSDNHVVALDVADGVRLGEAPRLVAEIGVLPGDGRGRIGALEGEATVARAPLAVRGRDLDCVDGVEVQGIEHLGRDRHAEGVALRGVVDGADDLVVELLSHIDRVSVCVVDRILVSKAQVLVAQVGVDAAD